MKQRRISKKAALKSVRDLREEQGVVPAPVLSSDPSAPRVRYRVKSSGRTGTKVGDLAGYVLLLLDPTSPDQPASRKPIGYLPTEISEINLQGEHQPHPGPSTPDWWKVR